MSISRTSNNAYVICTSSTRPGSPLNGSTIYETDTDKTFVYTGSLWVPLTPSILDTRYLEGTQAAYSGSLNGASTNYLKYDATNNLELLYTPPIDAWWEVTLRISLLQKLDAAYHYAYGMIELSPAPVTGTAVRHSIIVQHSSVNYYMSFDITTLYKLAANTAYTAKSVFGNGNGGSWQHYRGGGHLDMHAYAWAR